MTFRYVADRATEASRNAKSSSGQTLEATWPGRTNTALQRKFEIVTSLSAPDGSNGLRDLTALREYDLRQEMFL